MTTTINTRVIVSKPVSTGDKLFRNRTGVLVEFTRPHGFARVRLDDASGVEDRLANPSTCEILVHPESLTAMD